MNTRVESGNDAGVVNGVTVIGFDADDTLWESESFFAVTEERFVALLAPWCMSTDVSAALLATERTNLSHFGYGVKGFTLSMIETAIELTEGAIPSNALAEIPALLKRTALAVFPRADVAGLSGEAWLGFLDASAGSTDFSSGPGRLLADLPYSPAAASPPADQMRELLKISRRWIRRHRRMERGD